MGYLRRQILGAALQLFARNGFQGTSMRALARAVGLSLASLYYYFPSKAAILRALYEERGFEEALRELEALPGRLPLERQLEANALASAQLWHRNHDLLRLVMMEVLRGDRAALQVHQALVERWRRGIGELLSRYRERGEIGPQVDVEAAAQRWVHLLFGAFMDRLLAMGRARAFLTPELARYLGEVAREFAQALAPPREKEGEA